MTDELRAAIAVLATAAEREIEDIETGIEDGTYDKDESNAARIAALNDALQAVAPFTAEPASEPAPVQPIIVNLCEEEGTLGVENIPAGQVVEVRCFPGYETFRSEYRDLTDEEREAEGLSFDGEAWHFTTTYGAEGSK